MVVIWQRLNEVLPISICLQNTHYTWLMQTLNLWYAGENIKGWQVSDEFLVFPRKKKMVIYFIRAHYILEESNFIFKYMYVRLCVSDIPGEKWQNYFKQRRPWSDVAECTICQLPFWFLKTKMRWRSWQVTPTFLQLTLKAPIITIVVCFVFCWLLKKSLLQTVWTQIRLLL